MARAGSVRWSASTYRNYRVRFGGEIRNWSVDGYIQAKDIKRFDRFVQFAQVAGVDAVKDSGIDFTKYDPWRCGVILGSGIGGLETIEIQHERLLSKGPDKVSAFTIPKLIGNAASAELSILYGLRGPNQVVVTACASAANAIGDACKLIRDDEADVMITGGSEAAMTHMGLGGFAATRALSERNDNPTLPAGRSTATATASSSAKGPAGRPRGTRARQRPRRPDLRRTLRLRRQRRRRHITAPHQDGVGAAHAMSLRPQRRPHQSGGHRLRQRPRHQHPLGDAAETRAIKQVFGDHARKLAISSTKSMVGHLLGASGGVELIACVLSIKHSVVHPTINSTPPTRTAISTTCRTRPGRGDRRAISNSFGFGGHNCSLVVGEAAQCVLAAAQCATAFAQNGMPSVLLTAIASTMSRNRFRPPI